MPEDTPKVTPKDMPKDTPEDIPEEEERIMRVVIRASSREELMELLKEQPLDLGPTREKDGVYEVDAYIQAGEIKGLKRAGVRRSGLSVEVVEDATEVGRRRQREVGGGNRFTRGREKPLGLGKKE